MLGRGATTRCPPGPLAFTGRGCTCGGARAPCCARPAARARPPRLNRRDKEGATPREQRAAFAALFKAAGLRAGAPPRQQPHKQHKQQQQQEEGQDDQQQQQQQQPEPVPRSPGWWLVPPLHAGAIREVARSLAAGRGADADQALALTLFDRAAALGDAAAHGQMGLRYAVGLARAESLEGGGIKHFDGVGTRGGWGGARACGRINAFGQAHGRLGRRARARIQMRFGGTGRGRCLR